MDLSPENELEVLRRQNKDLVELISDVRDVFGAAPYFKTSTRDELLIDRMTVAIMAGEAVEKRAYGALENLPFDRASFKRSLQEVLG